MITSWKDMPLGVFSKIYDIQCLHITEDEKIIKITALLAGMKEEEILSMPLVDTKELIAQTHFMYTEPKRHHVRRRYRLGDKNYIIMRDVTEMTTAQYINYQAIAGRPVNEILPNLMALVLVPEGEKYGDSHEQDVIDDIMKYLSIEDALSVADFFTRSFERSMRRMLRYSDGIMKAAVLTAKKKDKEKMKAMALEMRLITDALRSEYGFRW